MSRPLWRQILLRNTIKSSNSVSTYVPRRDIIALCGSHSSHFVALGYQLERLLGCSDLLVGNRSEGCFAIRLSKDVMPDQKIQSTPNRDLDTAYIYCSRSLTGMRRHGPAKNTPALWLSLTSILSVL